MALSIPRYFEKLFQSKNFSGFEVHSFPMAVLVRTVRCVMVGRRGQDRKYLTGLADYFPMDPGSHSTSCSATPTPPSANRRGHRTTGATIGYQAPPRATKHGIPQGQNINIHTVIHIKART